MERHNMTMIEIILGLQIISLVLRFMTYRETRAHSKNWDRLHLKTEPKIFKSRPSAYDLGAQGRLRKRRGKK